MDKVQNQSEAYLDKYDKQQLKHHANRRAKRSAEFLTGNRPTPQPNAKQNHFTLHVEQKKQIRKNKTQPNTSHLFKSASIKQLPKFNYLPNKQERPINILFYSAKISQANNASILFHRKENAKYVSNYPGIETSVIKNTRSHHRNTSNTNLGISRVTATSDSISTLFFLDTAIRYWTKNPHRPQVKVSNSINKCAERQIQRIMERRPTK